MYINDKFRVQVSESGEIINLNELIQELEKTDITDELEIFLTNLQNRINNSEYINKNELVSAIKGKILGYEANKNQMIQSNSESLKLMQSFNVELKNLGIISTKKENNDSNKNIDYLTYTNESGEVEVLVCMGDNTLNEFIKSHAEEITKYKAKDIFRYFKEYIHKSLGFDLAGKNQEYEENTKEKTREESIKQQEYEEVKKYANTYSIDAKIEVAVDPNGERIYRVKDGLFKFKTENGIRVMEILQTPSITKEDTVDLIDELKKSENNMQFVQTNIINDIDTHNPVYNYDSLPSCDLSEERINKVIELIQKRDIYGVELTSEKLMIIDITIKALIETMINRASSPNIKEDNLLVDFMTPLIDKYNQINEGIIDRSILSELEIRMCEEYLHNKEYIEANNLYLNNKKLELASDNNENYQSGIATIVILLEIMLLALFILMFSHLDI